MIVRAESKKMKIALINPPTSFDRLYGEWDLSPLDTYTPPLGVLSLAGYLRAEGHEPFLLDLMALPLDLDRGVRHILARRPDVVGLSAMTINCLDAGALARALKERGLLAPIVLGGAHVSAVPRETLEAFPDIDYGVVGEGEATLAELLDRLGNRESLQQVDGLAWRDPEGRVVINRPRRPLENLDELPLPAWDLLEGFPSRYPSSLLESRRLPAAGIMTSRGCPFHCTFCDNRVFGSRVRHFSAEYTLRMIRHLVDRFGIRDLMILDDNFLLDRRKLFDICDGIRSQNLDLTWYCITHAKSMTPDRLAKIRRAGCWFVEMGIESGNDAILGQIKKNTDKAEIRASVRAAKRTGLKVKGNFIFGFPGDTPETIEETIRFALDLDIDFFQQSYLTVWPGCEISRTAPKTDAPPAEVWGRLAHQRITFVPPAMTRDQLVSASKESFRRFYLRPRTIIRLLPRLASLRGIRFSLTALAVFLRTILRKPAAR
jgi:anaerobic magnesium-protoporphyrin IX monomethyl ester cyclase